jgi:hypothetical protein
MNKHFKLYVIQCVFCLYLIVQAGCEQDKDSIDNENKGNKQAIEEYYKQFDTTLTKEQVDSFKTKYDSINRWRDTKRKRAF